MDDAERRPHYKYNGHWAWVYFFNGEANDADGMNAFDWAKGVISA